MVGPSFACVVVIALAALLSGCKEAEEASVSSGYQPSVVEEVADSDVQRVTFTKIGADRLDLATVAAAQQGDHTVVPYSALIYDGQGVSWVYTASSELTFLRAEVVVDRIEGDTVLLSDGLSPGARIVTVGAAEVYGAELGIDGGH